MMKLKITCFIVLFLMVSVNLLNTDNFSVAESLEDEEWLLSAPFKANLTPEECLKEAIESLLVCDVYADEELEE